MASIKIRQMEKFTVTIHRSFFLCVGIFMLHSANSQSEKITKNIAIKWIAFVNKHDSASVAMLYSDNGQMKSPNWEGTKEGVEEIRGVYSRYFTSTPDLQYNINTIISTDTAAIIEYTFSGTLSNPEHNTPAYMRGKKYRLSACTVMNIRKGKITRQDFYFDQVAFLRQMGFFEQK
jgi:steroid delta-isomerase-like uncharacterized protein